MLKALVMMQMLLTTPTECPNGAHRFYACLPPAYYVPDPGHCEYPDADMVPADAPVVILCGVEAK